MEGFAAFAGVLDIARDRPHVRRRAPGTRTWPPAERALRAFLPLDPTGAKPVDACTAVALAKRAFLELLAYAMLAGVACAVVVWAPQVAPAPAARAIVRWAAGVPFIYALPEVATRALQLVAYALGHELPPMHRVPIAARSVGEFWSERWNRPVGAWLRFHAFRPLARRGWTRTGALAAFALSALVHLHFTWAAAGFTMAMTMAVYFLVQGLVVVVESLLRVTRWRPSLARTWTLAVMLVTSPIFVEPMLRAVGL
jgi:hypothetical protein